ncbi:MAG: hypothetical protein HC802_12845 [Caldilineaceae bacterium]|nr:hypothetical protein [Caldilineaceae bacterium]
MRKSQDIFDGNPPPGIYRLSSRTRPAAILAAIDAAGWRGFYLDGRGISSKPAFLAASAHALAFPDYFGHIGMRSRKV